MKEALGQPNVEDDTGMKLLGENQSFLDMAVQTSLCAVRNDGNIASDKKYSFGGHVRRVQKLERRRDKNGSNHGVVEAVIEGKRHTRMSCLGSVAKLVLNGRHLVARQGSALEVPEW